MPQPLDKELLNLHGVYLVRRSGAGNSPDAALFHGKLAHPPDSRATRDIRDSLVALLFQHVRGLHAAVATLADEQDIFVGGDLFEATGELAEGDVAGALRMAARKLKDFADIYQHGVAVRGRRLLPGVTRADRRDASSGATKQPIKHVHSSIMWAVTSAPKFQAPALRITVL